MRFDQSSAATERLALAEADTQARAARGRRADRYRRIGAVLGNSVTLAVAETATPPTIETPYGRAPLSFADLAAKVSPAVVSINVKGDVKVADNDMEIPGMPDLPEDNPLYEFFKQFRKGMPQAPTQALSELGPGLGLLHFVRRFRRDQQSCGRGRRGHHGHAR